MNKKILNFWKKNAENIYWFQFPKNIFEFKNNFFKWYDDGKTNVALNCLEHKHFDTSKKIAIVYCNKNKEVSKFTYKQLNNYISKFSHYLSTFKNKKKTIKIMIHGSASIETSISMLACAKLGFEHCVVFENLSKEAFELRIKLFKPNILVSRCDITQYKKDIKPVISKFLDISFIHFSENKLNVKIKNKINLSLLNKYKKIISAYKIIKSNNNLFTLFTSGSTGMPKGVIHSSGGYLSYIKFTCTKQFGMNDKSIVLTASDAGWMNGHTYALYGPLSCGATTIILETPISLLDEEFINNILINYKINILYLPVTLIRLMKSIFNNKKIKTKYLKTLGSMGEPLAPSVGEWFAKYFSLKNKAIVNTYYQTETGGIICSPRYTESNKTSPHGSVGKPVTTFLNINNKIKKFDKEFIIKNLWPGCMINLVNGKKEWNKYWTEEKYFRMFDISHKDNKNNFYIQGRVDDVINIRGHRIGTAEIESIILKYTLAKEASVITTKDELEGDIIILFISANDKNIIKNNIIEKILIKYFGSYAIPKDIFVIKELPKTRSGKILRRVLRTLYLNPNKKNIGDISTMINMNSIEDIRKSIINSIHN